MNLDSRRSKAHSKTTLVLSQGNLATLELNDVKI